MSNPSINERSFVQSTANSSTPNSVTEQLHKLKQLMFAQDTVRTLGQSLRLVFVLIRETLLLIWLAICWAIVAVSWLGRKTDQASQQLKHQWETFQETHQHQSASDVAAETGKTILTKGKTALDQIVTEAKKQVGIHDE